MQTTIYKLWYMYTNNLVVSAFGNQEESEALIINEKQCIFGRTVPSFRIISVEASNTKVYYSLVFIHFIILLFFRIFLQDPFPANPDLLYLVIFIHSNLTTTVTLAFLFGSKVSIQGLLWYVQLCFIPISNILGFILRDCHAWAWNLIYIL